MKFLVAINRSPEATEAIDSALTFANGMHADVIIAHAVNSEVTEILKDRPISTLSGARERIVMDHLQTFEVRGVATLERA